MSGARRSARKQGRHCAVAIIVAILCAIGLNNVRVAAQGSNPAPGLPPAAAASPDGGQYAWWQGQDGNLWEKWYDPGSGTWKGPANLGDGPLGSAPGATTVTGQQDVFWRGTDNNLWETWYTGGTWYGPANLGYGNLASAPGVGSVYSSGAQFVFWKGSNGDLWEAWYSGHWYGPADIGMGPLGSAPTVAVDASGNQYVFWEGTDAILREAWYTGSWHGPIIPVGGTGPMGSAPSATYAASTQEVFWAGTDGNLWETWYTGVWNGPAEVVATGYGSMGTAPSAATLNSQTDAFWWGEGALWEAWYTSGWNGPQTVFVDKCEITRPSDDTAYKDGWAQDPGARIGGIWSKILNYSPWVWPETVGVLINDATGAVQLSDDHGDIWQLGWEEWPYGNRYTLECFAQPNSSGGYDNVCVDNTAPAQPVDAFTEYKIEYDNTPYEFTYFIDNAQIDGVPTDFDQLMPLNSAVQGQILTVSDQMPGGYDVPEQFTDTNWWYPSSWQPYNAQQNIHHSPANLFGNQPVSGTQDNIWDWGCAT